MTYYIHAHSDIQFHMEHIAPTYLAINTFSLYNTEHKIIMIISNTALSIIRYFEHKWLRGYYFFTNARSPPGRNWHFYRPTTAENAKIQIFAITALYGPKIDQNSQKINIGRSSPSSPRKQAVAPAGGAANGPQ